MKLAVVGSGNVGGALAKGLAKAGHQVLLGARDVNAPKVKSLLEFHEGIGAHTINEAAQRAEVILLAATPQAVKEISDKLGDTNGKVIIDAMNSVFAKPEPFSNTTAALLEYTSTRDIVKCFNTTGFENMFDPIYDGQGIDTFMAGDSDKAKELAGSLAKDLGFAECYDFGGSDKFDLLEQLAMSWINLALMQGQGRGMAFKVLKR